MPRITYIHSVATRDRLKGIILEQKKIQKLTADDMAEIAHISRSSYFRFMEMPSSEWLSVALVMCKGLGITESEFKEAIKY